MKCRPVYPSSIPGSAFVAVLAVLLLMGAQPAHSVPPFARMEAHKTSILPPVAPDARRDYVVVLMWHDVVRDHKEVWFDTTVAELRHQLDAIRRAHCTIITLADLYRHLSTGSPVPPRSVVLTFDDNYRGLYDFAYPILREYRFPATFFAHTNYIGVTTVKPHCTWEQLKEMQASGWITVQAQTRSHPADIRLLSDAQIWDELTGAMSVMERRLGKPVWAMSYPDGNYNDRVARIVAQAGYKLAVMEDWGNAGESRNLLEVHRYSTHRRFAQALRDITRAWIHRNH